MDTVVITAIAITGVGRILAWVINETTHDDHLLA